MNTLDTSYQNLVSDILNNGTYKFTRNGQTISVFGRQIRHNMSNGFPVLTTKKMAWKQIVTELYWFLSGYTNVKFLIDNDCHIWDNDVYRSYLEEFKIERVQLEQEKLIGKSELLSKEELIHYIQTNNDFAFLFGHVGPVYGKQWRDFADDYDQIEMAIKLLLEDPDSRRILVTAWDPCSLDYQILPPCHYAFQFYTRELSLTERCNIAGLNSRTENVDAICNELNIPKRAISLCWNQRSVDLPLGLPFNIASYGLLLMIIANIVNMVPEDLIGNLGDCHIYVNQIESVSEQLKRTPYDLPTLDIATPIPEKSSIDEVIFSVGIEDYKLVNYKYHNAIKIPLS
jgi:thymidylate synthase